MTFLEKKNYDLYNSSLTVFPSDFYLWHNTIVILEIKENGGEDTEDTSILKEIISDAP